MKNPLSLGKKLKHARKEAGLSQKDLAQILKLSDKAISSYEVDRSQPSLETLKEIGEATHRPVTYFLDAGDDEEIELQVKLKRIEKELADIKTILKQKNKSI